MGVQNKTSAGFCMACAERRHEANQSIAYAERVGEFLTSGPSCDDDSFDEDEVLGRDEYGRWEYAA